MMISKRVGAAFLAVTLGGAWIVPAPAAELPVLPAPKVVRTAGVKKVRRHRPIRLVAADWPAHAAYRANVSYLVLGVAY
jgi:hypothetical protein